MKETDRDSTKRMHRRKIQAAMRHEEYIMKQSKEAAEAFRRKPYEIRNKAT